MEGKREAEAFLGHGYVPGAFRWQRKKKEKEREKEKKEDWRSRNALKAFLDGVKGKEKGIESKEKGEKRLSDSTRTKKNNKTKKEERKG